jgi:hypothetical protein
VDNLQSIILPPRLQDLRGQTFGRLTVTSYVGCQISGRKQYHCWRCVCTCGGTPVVQGRSLRRGDTRSCGCLGLEHSLSGNARRRHGMKHTSEYNTWNTMYQRCHNPNCASYKNYGGRGVKVCKRWQKSFDNFFSDMGRKPSPSHCLERINNDGDYEPGNCCWATRAEQSCNKRNNRILIHNGEALIAAEWSRRTGISDRQILRRIDIYGWSVADALTTPVRHMRRSNPR